MRLSVAVDSLAERCLKGFVNAFETAFKLAFHGMFLHYSD